MRVVEENVPFAKSAIWDYQQHFYSRMATDAWSRYHVPHYITDNPVIAGAYANMASGFLRDIRHQGAETVYILELGAGHGRFTYRFLKHFDHLSRILDLPSVCYITSDFAYKNVEYLESNPRLRPFAERGMLDFAVFDMEKDTEIHLRRTDKTIAQGSLTQPIIVIANYVFDTIRQDLFYIDGGQISPCRLTLETGQEDMSGGVSLDELSIGSSYEASDEPAFEEQYLLDILEGYRGLSDTYLLLPSTGIRCMERLRALTSNGVMLLTGDKGYSSPEQLAGAAFPSFVIHAGAFSLMVNYDALHKYCENSGGRAFYPRLEHISISTECLLFMEEPERFTETRLAYESFVDGYGPDEFCSVSTMLKAVGSIDFEQWTSIIRHSGYDPEIFISFLPQLCNLLVELPPERKRALIGVARQIWEMHYPLEKGENLALELGKVLILVGFLEEAVGFCKLSIEECGYRSETVQNLIFCYCHMGDYESGIRLLETLRDGSSD